MRCLSWKGLAGQNSSGDAAPVASSGLCYRHLALTHHGGRQKASGFQLLFSSRPAVLSSQCCWLARDSSGLRCVTHLVAFLPCNAGDTQSSWLGAHPPACILHLDGVHWLPGPVVNVRVCVLLCSRPACVLLAIQEGSKSTLLSWLQIFPEF